YTEVNALLDSMDIVLYESVRPSGSQQPSGSTEEEKVSSTLLSLEFVANIAKKSAEETGGIPNNLEEVIADASILDRRLSSWVEDASVDAWGRPFSVQVDTEHSTITFWSFGSDGAVGGTSHAADLTVSRDITFLQEGDTAVRDADKNIQQELAEVLGFEFQLESLSYEDPNWFCSDMTIDEVQSKLEERGADPAVIDMITGNSFTAKIASGMMKVLPMLDALTGGGIQSTARLLMIEMLSLPESSQMLEGLEPELAQVIIIDRNTVVLQDIAAMFEIAEDASSVGVLYGAGHMPDLENRIHTLFGYVPVEDRWISTMSVNPKDSFLDEGDIKRMRFML
ncbi:MAG TPA: hypothetical protein EYO31_00620, partial [Phycisphaerales bacterium]|nr:hypothetical protein [Phycisphaerales bacterium]